MDAYLDLVRRIRAEGSRRGDRTGTGTLSLFGHQLRFDLSRGFPAVTTKKLYMRSVIYELLWFLRGSSNVAWLRERGVSIWDAWADPEGELGPIYGVQWRSWPTPGGGSVDQLAQVIGELRRDPESRRLLVSAWNVAELGRMALPPCHTLFQFHVSGGRLSCQLYQRSADVFLGLPFNIASYSLLTCMVAQVVGLQPGEFIHVLGDAHLYLNHLAQAEELLRRAPLPPPRLVLNPAVREIDDFTFEDIALDGYRHHPPLHAPISV